MRSSTTAPASSPAARRAPLRWRSRRSSRTSTAVLDQRRRRRDHRQDCNAYTFRWSSGLRRGARDDVSVHPEVPERQEVVYDHAVLRLRRVSSDQRQGVVQEGLTLIGTTTTARATEFSNTSRRRPKPSRRAVPAQLPAVTRSKRSRRPTATGSRRRPDPLRLERRSARLLGIGADISTASTSGASMARFDAGDAQSQRSYKAAYGEPLATSAPAHTSKRSSPSTGSLARSRSTRRVWRKRSRLQVTGPTAEEVRAFDIRS